VSNAFGSPLLSGVRDRRLRCQASKTATSGSRLDVELQLFIRALMPNLASIFTPAKSPLPHPCATEQTKLPVRR
jgi:hypothetical protein